MTDREKLLQHIVKMIEEGKYNSSYISLDKLFQIYTDTRQEYIPPYQRDNLNYGYEDIGQMGFADQQR